MHMALHGNLSGPVCSTDLAKVSKDATSLVVYTRKKISYDKELEQNTKIILKF